MASIDVVSYNRQGKVFTGANTAAKAVIAVTTAMTGLILLNPYGSGKKLVLVDAGWASSVVGTGVGNLGIAVAPSVVLGPTSTGVSTCTGPLVADGSGGAGASIAKVYDAATFVTAPVMNRWIGGNIWVTGGAGDHPYQIMDRIDGSLILAPGAAAMFSVVTTTMTGLGHFTWAEVPV